MADIRRVKTCVFGIQGSGKTYLTEHHLIKAFKHPLVYLMHPEDFQSCKNNVELYIPYKIVDGKKIIDKSVEHLNWFMGKFIEWAKEGKYDAIIIDEADLFIPKNIQTLQRYPHILDAIDNHRHYGKTKGNGFAMVFISRRPQEISTLIVETAEHTFIFALEGKNVVEYFSQINGEYEKLFPLLNKERHNFIYKHLGENPKIVNGVKTPTKLKEQEANGSKKTC